MFELQKFGNIPFNYTALAKMLHGYQSPYDKVSAMEKHGEIIRLKKGLYVVSDKISRKQISRELIANHLYGVSYISLETALSFYGMIPEKVHSVLSITTKRSKQFENPLGHFDFITVPTGYFPIGIRQQIVDNEFVFLIATPEKAICDLILSTPHLRLQSVHAVQVYLEDDLRIDFSVLQNIDKDIIRQCSETGKKKGELKFLLKFFEMKYGKS